MAAPCRRLPRSDKKLRRAFQKVVAFDSVARRWETLADFPDFRWLGTAAVLRDPASGRATLAMGFGTTCLKGLLAVDEAEGLGSVAPPHRRRVGAPSPPFSGNCTRAQDDSNLPAYGLQLGEPTAEWRP